MFNSDDFIITFLDGRKFTAEEIRNNSELNETVINAVTNPDYLYTPHERLSRRVAEYRTWCQTRTGENAGRLMEEIAYLAFSGLRGWNSILSYQSYADQIDLVVSGDQLWEALLIYLGLSSFTVIVVEAKNTDDPVDVAQFTHLCSIVQNNFATTCGLGVFVTRSGASGFAEDQRIRALQFAQATQIIFHAKTQKFVIVLTDTDIENLLIPGGLPRMIRDKMQRIEAFTGLDLSLDPNSWRQVDLPPHLSKY